MSASVIWLIIAWIVMIPVVCAFFYHWIDFKFTPSIFFALAWPVTIVFSLIVFACALSCDYVEKKWPR